MLSLKPSTKLVAEIALAAMFVFFYTLHWTDLPAADMLLTLVWIVGITNAFTSSTTWTGSAPASSSSPALRSARRPPRRRR